MTTAAGMGDISCGPTSRQLMAERGRAGLLLYLVISFQVVISKKKYTYEQHKPELSGYVYAYEIEEEVKKTKNKIIWRQ